MVKKKIIFASNNAHKLNEINALLSNNFEILGLKDVNFTAEIIESGNTFHENSYIKTSAIVDFLNCFCFSDDSGLEVECLNGQPGVYSARFAGEKASDYDNINLLLQKMANDTNRNAQFKTVICLYFNNKYHYFEGFVKGQIAMDPRGVNGFGYDPVFIPEGFQKTFAELGTEIKNNISHRAMAIQKLVKFLNEND